MLQHVRAIHETPTGHTASTHKAHPGSLPCNHGNMHSSSAAVLGSLHHYAILWSSIVEMRSPVSVSCKRKLQRSTTGNPVGASHMVRCIFAICASPSFYNAAAPYEVTSSSSIVAMARLGGSRSSRSRSSRSSRST